MTPREKRTVLIGLGVIGAAVLLRGVLQPVAAQWGEARATIAQHETELDTLGRQLDRRDEKLRRLRQKYGPAVEAELLPVNEARPRFAEALQQTLRSGGMGVSSISLQGVRRSRDVPGVSMVTLRVEGSAGDGKMPSVLAALRGCAMLALLDDARIEQSGPGEPGKGPSHKLNLVVSTPALTERTP